MPAWLIILIAGFVIADVIALAVLFAWLRRREHTGKDNAPGWYFLCAGCGHARRASELNVVKVGAKPRNVSTRAACSACGTRGRVRLAHQETMSLEELDIVRAYEESHADNRDE
jgi:transcription elongation factor Elf1